MTSVFLQNFGCRVNQAEAFEWAERFQRRGLRLADDAAHSDLILVNTCTLTGRADRDVRKFLARVGRDNPLARVIVAGCLVDRDRAELERVPNVTLFTNKEKETLADNVLAMAQPGSGVAPVRFRARALLKVQDGCDCGCTFCIIPSVRGESRSRPPQWALARLEELASQGFREVVLTGIHLSSYGRDLEPKTSLPALLKDMDRRCPGLRLRLSSLDPRLLGPEMREFLASSAVICPHFHLSLQNGSDRVLRRMGRKSRRAEYVEILADLRRLAPDAALGADIITGFPGEDESDFRETFEFLQSSPLSYFHVFSYSPRPGTAASSWPQVSLQETRRRASLLRALSFEKNSDFRRSFLGQTREAVVIRAARDRVELLTDNYLKVLAQPGPWSEGDAVQVTLNKVEDRIAGGTIQD